MVNLGKAAHIAAVPVALESPTASRLDLSELSKNGAIRRNGWEL
jgi:hypothetical protein